MKWNSSLHAFIPTHLDVESELLRQAHQLHPVIQFIESFGVVTLGIIITLIIHFFITQNHFKDWYEAYPYMVVLRKPIELLLWCFYLVTSVRIVIAGVFTTLAMIKRIPDGFIDSQTLISNRWSDATVKAIWWATLHRVRGWILAFGIVLLSFVVAFHLESAIITYTSCDAYCLEFVNYFAKNTVVLVSIIFVLMIILLLLIQVTVSTFIGILAAKHIGDKGALLSALTIRLVPVIFFTLFPYLRTYGIHLIPYKRYIETKWFGLADMGTSYLMQMIHALGGGAPDPQEEAIYTLFIVTVVYGFSIIIMYFLIRFIPMSKRLSKSS